MRAFSWFMRSGFVALLAFTKPAIADAQWQCYFEGYYTLPPVSAFPVADPGACQAFIESKVLTTTLLSELSCNYNLVPPTCGSVVYFPWAPPPAQWVGSVFYYLPWLYTIKLSRPDGSSVDGTILDKIEPGSIGGPSTVDTTILVAKVYDQANQVVPDVAIQLTTDVIAHSGGHQHDDAGRHNNYAGKFSPVGIGNGAVSNNGKTLSGNTGTTGLFFRFASPAFPNNPAGDHTITATCTDGKRCTQQGPRQVWVGVTGLVSIPGSGLWALVGSTATHPNGHYLTAAALAKLHELAYLYHQAWFPWDPVLHLNDASLERGGLFDLFPSSVAWKVPHKEHRRGVVIDIRANGSQGAIPERNFEDFEYLLRELRMRWEPENLGRPNGHYHVRLLRISQ